MALLTHAPAFLLQLNDIKGMHGEASAPTPLPMAVRRLQRHEQARGLITRRRIPESLNGDDLVDLLLVPPS